MGAYIIQWVMKEKTFITRACRGGGFVLKEVFGVCVCVCGERERERGGGVYPVINHVGIDIAKPEKLSISPLTVILTMRIRLTISSFQQEEGESRGSPSPLLSPVTE